MKKILLIFLGILLFSTVVSAHVWVAGHYGGSPTQREDDQFVPPNWALRLSLMVGET